MSRGEETVYAVFPAKGKRGTDYELRLSLIFYNDDQQIDLREWRTVESGRTGPTRKGWRFTVEEARELQKELTHLLADIVAQEDDHRLGGQL